MRPFVTSGILLFAAIAIVAVGGPHWFPAADDAGTEMLSSGDECLIVVLEPSLADRCRERSLRLAEQLGTACRGTLVQPPWVLAGDLSASELERKYVEVVQPTAAAMQVYVRDVPSEPVAVLMFTTEAAYRENAERLFFDRHVSRFGYYKPGRRAIMVNLAEGDGPLLHELTHALIAHDFPAAPSWLDEGLATLHETSRLPELEPLPNWRMHAVLRDLQHDTLPTLHHLATATDFAGATEAVDYAHARSLCLFLHARNVLPAVYRQTRAQATQDPTGAAALLQLSSHGDWPALEAAFRSWLRRSDVRDKT